MSDELFLTSDLFLEILRSLVMLAIVISLWRASRREPMRKQKGWRTMLVGFTLIFIGSLFDITDEPETNLDGWIMIGDTPVQAFFEKVVGFLLGFLLLAIGFRRLLPSLVEGERAKRELKRAHDELEEHVEERTVELTDEIDRRIRVEDELDRARVRAEAANLTKSRFLANMSHELRTPLNSVIGFAQRLLKNPSSPFEERQTFLKRIADNGRHLLSLIDQILDLAKVEEGRSDVTLETVTLEDLVAQLHQEYCDRFRDQGVSLTTEVPPDLQPIHTDRERLRQILTNLLDNAFKFTSAGSVTVSVHATPGGRPTRIDVVDTGLGISEEDRRLVFEPFGQSNPKVAGELGGTGLGLSICRSLTKLLGFQLEVQSELGRGSTFSLVLSN